jgi:succinylarginine dihydrolase
MCARKPTAARPAGKPRRRISAEAAPERVLGAAEAEPARQAVAAVAARAWAAVAAAVVAAADAVVESSH